MHGRGPPNWPCTCADRRTGHALAKRAAPGHLGSSARPRRDWPCTCTPGLAMHLWSMPELPDLPRAGTAGLAMHRRGPPDWPCTGAGRRTGHALARAAELAMHVRSEPRLAISGAVLGHAGTGHAPVEHAGTSGPATRRDRRTGHAPAGRPGAATHPGEQSALAMRLRAVRVGQGLEGPSGERIDRPCTVVARRPSSRATLHDRDRPCTSALSAQPRSSSGASPESA